MLMREKTGKEGEAFDYTNEKPDDVFRWLQKVMTRKTIYAFPGFLALFLTNSI